MKHFFGLNRTPVMLNDAPTFFHGSRDGKISKFWAMTHFGTLEAAEGILSSTPVSKRYIYKCKIIGFDHAIEIKDGGTPRPSQAIVQLAEECHLLPAGTKEENFREGKKILVKVLNAQMNCTDGNYILARGLVREELLKRGIRILKYKNNVEGSNDDYSITVVDPADIRIIEVIFFDAGSKLGIFGRASEIWSKLKWW